MKRIIILGSTGSVGLNALEIVRSHPQHFHVVGLAASKNAALLQKQMEEFNPERVCLFDEDAAGHLKQNYTGPVRIGSGEEGLRALVRDVSSELVIAASSGSSSLIPVYEAVKAGQHIAVANKEILVMAGRLIMEAARQSGARILPVDSEHNAIFQCLDGCQSPATIHQLILTGSGGPLREVPLSQFSQLTKEQVLKHPKWNMGQKITVDSATLMNKGLEVIEARWLFDVGVSQIKVLIHPEAVVHSMVEFIDGSILAQMGPTDMKLPLIHTMMYPDRARNEATHLNLSLLEKLHFIEPDYSKFRCFQLAREVALEGDTTLSAVLNAADELAVNAFLKDQLSFIQISEVIEGAICQHKPIRKPSLEAILAADEEARCRIHEALGAQKKKVKV